MLGELPDEKLTSLRRSQRANGDRVDFSRTLSRTRHVIFGPSHARCRPDTKRANSLAKRSDITSESKTIRLEEFLYRGNSPPVEPNSRRRLWHHHQFEIA